MRYFIYPTTRQMGYILDNHDTVNSHAVAANVVKEVISDDVKKPTMTRARLRAYQTIIGTMIVPVIGLALITGVLTGIVSYKLIVILAHAV